MVRWLPHRMGLSLNLAAAVALALVTVSVTLFGHRLRDGFHRFDTIQLVSVTVALVLVPVNLVFALTRVMGAFNGIVLALSLIGFALQAMLMMHWSRGNIAAPAAPEPVEEAPVSRVRPVRVLAVGVDEHSFDPALLATFDEAGHEVYALVLGDSLRTSVAHAQRTIVVRFPFDQLAELRPEIAEAAAEHIRSLSPDLVLLPNPDHAQAAEAAVGSAARYAVGDLPVLYFSHERFDATEPTVVLGGDDWPFRPDPGGDSGRVRMPSFADPAT
jgi:hypothetical protein